MSNVVAIVAARFATRLQQSAVISVLQSTVLSIVPCTFVTVLSYNVHL